MTPLQASAWRAAQEAPDPFTRGSLLVMAYTLGDPYWYGRAGPDAWDCSGLVRFACALIAKVGGWTSEPVPLARSAGAIWRQCGRVILAPFPGAIGGWGDPRSGVCSHVGLTLTTAGHVLSASGGRSTTRGDDPRAYVRVEGPGYWSSHALGYRPLLDAFGREVYAAR